MSGDTKKWLKILFAVAMAAPILAAIFAASGPFAQFGQGVQGYCHPASEETVRLRGPADFVLSTGGVDTTYKWADPLPGNWRIARPGIAEDRIPDGQTLRSVVIGTNGSPFFTRSSTGALTDLPTGNGVYHYNNAIYGMGVHVTTPIDLDLTKTGQQNCDSDTEYAKVGSGRVTVTAGRFDATSNTILKIEQGSAIANNSYAGILVVAFTLIPVGLLGVFFFKLLGGTVGQSRRRKR